jgi:hypothetical protein
MGDQLPLQDPQGALAKALERNRSTIADQPDLDR